MGIATGRPGIGPVLGATGAPLTGVTVQLSGPLTYATTPPTPRAASASLASAPAPMIWKCWPRMGKAPVPARDAGLPEGGTVVQDVAAGHRHDHRRGHRLEAAGQRARPHQRPLLRRQPRDRPGWLLSLSTWRPASTPWRCRLRRATPFNGATADPSTCAASDAAARLYPPRGHRLGVGPRAFHRHADGPHPGGPFEALPTYAE